MYKIVIISATVCSHTYRLRSGYYLKAVSHSFNVQQRHLVFTVINQPFSLRRVRHIFECLVTKGLQTVTKPKLLETNRTLTFFCNRTQLQTLPFPSKSLYMCLYCRKIRPQFSLLILIMHVIKILLQSVLLECLHLMTAIQMMILMIMMTTHRVFWNG